jgi:hypothetical protein
LFDPVATISSSRSAFDWPLRAATVKGGRRPSRSDFALDRREHSGTLDDQASFSAVQDDKSEGSSPSGARLAPQTCIRSIAVDRNHDAVMRIGGEAPGRRAHSTERRVNHVPLRVTATSDR